MGIHVVTPRRARRVVDAATWIIDRLPVLRLNFHPAETGIRP
jgi:hypothetical protein